jgi:hypothetical protein
MLGPFYNAGILAAGTFHSSHLPKVYVKLGEQPLSLWRDLLLCSYAARLAGHPQHASYSVVFFPTLHYMYEIKTGALGLVEYIFNSS